MSLVVALSQLLLFIIVVAIGPSIVPSMVAEAAGTPTQTHTETIIPTYFPKLPTHAPTPSPPARGPHLIDAITDLFETLNLRPTSVTAAAFAGDPEEPMLYFSTAGARSKMIGAYSIRRDHAMFIAGHLGENVCNASIWNHTGQYEHVPIGPDQHSGKIAKIQNATTLPLSYPSGIDVISGATSDLGRGPVHQLVLADGMPSSRIFWLRFDPHKNKIQPALPVSKATELRYIGETSVLRLVGRGCNYTQKDLVEDATISPLPAAADGAPPIGPPKYVKYRKSTGQIFFSQYNFIAVAELSNASDPTSPRVQRRYFGQQNLVGNYTHFFNNVSVIDRKLVTTKDVGQMDILDDRYLFVAEGGMGVVRRIDLETGEVTIVAGQILHTFPPRNCTLEPTEHSLGPCTPTDVIFTRPTGLAIHKDQNSGTVSLFVADTSMSVIYRIFLQNNTIIRFAGQLPYFIWPNPAITKNNTNGTAYLDCSIVNCTEYAKRYISGNWNMSLPAGHHFRAMSAADSQGEQQQQHFTKSHHHAFKAQEQTFPPARPMYEDIRFGAVRSLALSPDTLFVASSRGMWALNIPEPTVALPPTTTAVPGVPPTPAPPQRPPKGLCTNLGDCNGHATDVIGIPFVSCQCICKPRWATTSDCAFPVNKTTTPSFHQTVTKTLLPRPSKTRTIRLSKTRTIPLTTLAPPPTSFRPRTATILPPREPTQSKTVLLPPLLEPPILNPETVDAAKTTATVAIVAVGVVQTPTVATQGARGILLLSIQSCVLELDEPLDWIDSLLQLQIKSLGEHRYYAGAVVGNVAAIVGGTFLHWFVAVAVMLHRRRHWESSSGDSLPSFHEAAATVRFPSMFFFPVMLVFQGTVGSSTLLLRHLSDNLTAVTIGLIGETACFTLIVLLSVFLFFNFRAFWMDNKTTKEEETAAVHNHSMRKMLAARQGPPDETDIQRLLGTPPAGPQASSRSATPLRGGNGNGNGSIVRGGRSATPLNGGGNGGGGFNGSTTASPATRRPVRQQPMTCREKIESVYLQWTEANGAWREPTELQCKRFGGVFKDYRPGVYYFALVELGLAFVLGILDGIKAPGTMCLYVLGTLALLYFALFFAYLLLRPLLSRLALVIYTFVAGLQALSALLLFVAAVIKSRRVQAWGENLALAALFIMGIASLIDCIIRLGYIVKYVVVWIATRNDKKRRSPDSAADKRSDAELSNMSALLGQLLGPETRPLDPTPNGNQPFDNFSFGGYTPALGPQASPNHIVPPNDAAGNDDNYDDDLSELDKRRNRSPDMQLPPAGPGRPPMVPKRRELMQHEINRMELDDLLNMGAGGSGGVMHSPTVGVNAASPPLARLNTSSINTSVAGPTAARAQSSSSSNTPKDKNSSGNGSMAHSTPTGKDTSSNSNKSFPRVSSLGQWRNSTSSFGSAQHAMGDSFARRRRAAKEKEKAEGNNSSGNNSNIHLDV